MSGIIPPFNTPVLRPNDTKTVHSTDMRSFTFLLDKDSQSLRWIFKHAIPTSNALERKRPTGKTSSPTSEKTDNSLNGANRVTPPVSGPKLLPQAPVKKRKTFYFKNDHEMQCLMRETSIIGWTRCTQCRRLHHSNHGPLNHLYCPIRYKIGY